MYSEGQLIYFDPFYFKNGNTAKPKYFLVLKNSGQTTVLASLPSSKLHLPQNLTVQHGCTEIREASISCYIFKADIEITTSNFAFEFDTILYGQWIDEFEIDLLNDIYKVEKMDYEIIGQLTAKEYQNIVDCFSDSASVKRKYKRMLSQKL